MLNAEQLQRVRDTADCLYSKDQVDRAVKALAGQISEQIADTDPIVLCAMNGGLVFGGKLLTELDFPLRQDYVHTSRYGDATVGAELRWLAEPRLDLIGQTVLIVDDILDQGITLKAIHQHCLDRGAVRVMSAVLVKKELREDTCCYSADFTALTCPDRYLMGCGLDYKGYWRNLPGIYALNLEASE